MEVNDRGEVSGKPKGKIFMAPSLVDMSGNKLTAEKKNEVFEALAKSENNVLSDDEYQKEIDDTVEYNANLKTVPDSYNKIKLNGNAVMIRLFKHPSIRKVGSMYIPNKLVVPYQTEGGKYATMENPLQYIHEGVIYNISDQCSETFRSKFKVGDVIDLKLGINLMQQRTYLKVEDFYNGEFDNHFIINESMIEKGSY